LRQLIELELPQGPSDRGHRIRRRLVRGQGRRSLKHRPQFVAAKQHAIATNPRLRKNHRTARRCPHRNDAEQQNRGCRQQQQGRRDEIEGSLQLQRI